MAFSAHKDADSLLERFEDEEALRAKAKVLAGWIRESKHMVAFTGAGVSTSTGIPDFRGPEGVWTLRAQGKAPTKRSTSTLKAVPSTTHMALVELMKRDILKYLISQNCDGLHRKSGIPTDRFSELHGNTNVDRCKDCGKEYLRDFYTRSATHVFEHDTGRICPVCNGPLLDTIVNFGENLPVKPLQLAVGNSRVSDLHVVLGSSLTVSPACDMPRDTAKRGGRLVIVNLQKTPLDHLAALRVFARTDDFMRMVMAELGVAIPTFRLHRFVRLTSRRLREGAGYKVVIASEDADGTPASILNQVDVAVTAGGGKLTQSVLNEPFVLRLLDVPPAAPLQLTFHFFGHYNELKLKLTHSLSSSRRASTLYHLCWDPFAATWTTEVAPPTPPAVGARALVEADEEVGEED